MVFLRTLGVWMAMLIVESAHGVFRRLVIEPWIGDFSARQISVFTGSVLILIMTYLFIPWIGANTKRQLTISWITAAGIAQSASCRIFRQSRWACYFPHFPERPTVSSYLHMNPSAFSFSAPFRTTTNT